MREGENGTKERSEKRVFWELERRRRILEKEMENIFGKEEEEILRRGGEDNFVISILTAHLVGSLAYPKL